MQLRTVLLEYFCQFRHFELNFTPGVNLIVGRNGSGKSNALKSIYGAITGDFRSRNAGTTADNVSQLARNGDKTQVHVNMDHNDMNIVVRRTLDKEGSLKSRLVVKHAAGTDSYTKTSEVTEKLLSVLGVSPKMMSDYIFVDQGGIADFIDETAGNRAKAFQRLFGTDKAAVVYDSGGKLLSKLEIQTTGDALATARKALIELQDKVKALTEQLSKYAWLPDDYQPAADPDTIIVTNYGKSLQLREQETTYRKDATKAAAETKEITDKLETLRTEVDETRSYLETQQADVEVAKQQLADWIIVRQIDGLKTKYSTLIQQRAAELEKADNNVPVAISTYIEKGEARTRVKAQIEFMSGRLVELKRQLDCVITGNCPTCGQSTDKLYDLNVLKDEIANTDARLSDFQAALTVSETFDNALAVHHNKRMKLKAEIDNYQEMLDSQPRVERPTKDEKALRQYLNDVTQLTQSIKAADAQLQTLRNKQQHAATQHETLTKLADTLTAKLAVMNVSQVEAELAEQRLKAKQDGWRVKCELKIRLQNAQESVEQAHKVVQELEAIERHASGLRAWHRHAENIRGLFHRDAAPRIAAQNYLEMLQEETNDLLERFDADFRVEADEGLSFTARFAKGKKTGAAQPAARLSGGEKVLLGLAFRVAVNSMFAQHIGLLILDEPTAYLDKGNLGCLDVAFTRLRELSRSCGLQVIIVTHEENLPAADNLIEIPTLE